MVESNREQRIGSMTNAGLGIGAIKQGDEVALVAGAARGDERALETLYERYRRPLYAYFNRMLERDTMSADDLFQELWIKVIRKLPDYREDGKFGAWLFRIAHNLALEHFRRLKSRAKLGVNTDDGELPDAPGTGPDPGSVLAGKELELRLEVLLSELPAEQREVFSMRQNDISFKEIADLQKCPINTALGRMHNVMRFLRRRLAE